MSKTLLEKVSSVESLKKAWDNLDKTNKSSHGISKETIEDFEKNKDDKIASISSLLLKGKYFFSPNRAVLIPKNNGKFRPLQIPEISDRVVLKAIAIELEEVFKELLEKSNGFSFAYQKGLGTKDAIFKIIEHYKNGYIYSLEADLINFFGKVNKDDLLNNYIYPKLQDASINKLLYKALNQELGGLDDFDLEKRSNFKDVDKGIPQGSPLSPLFSNIFLSPFDQFLIERDYKLVRYADDFVILCKTKEECENAYVDCCKILKELKLDIHSLEEGEKTKILKIDVDFLTFLSVTFDGKEIYPSIANFNRLKSKIRDVCNGKVDYTVFSLLKKLINIHDGWISSFIYTNLYKYSEELDFYIDRQLYLGLNKLGWRFSKTSLVKLPKKYRHDHKNNICISREQRLSSGIALSTKLIREKLTSYNENLENKKEK
ncbi:reverse transcriptase domain-containing protein [Flavobacterium sp. H4147]|uniref:reverse transcriptase domain-containing protein n=1 Tax=Flavobacterium sp. H4147 TaxID=3034149 RepID=UPI0023ED72FE|nr:reverse transcriptase domain-containing protein [Flavobacterium sp. H4147]